MKIRSDFVSNSSSCSFVVTDVQQMAAVLRADFKEQMNRMHWDLYEIEVSISAKRKDMPEICMAIKGEEFSEDSSSYWQPKSADRDSEEVIEEFGFDMQNVLYVIANELHPNLFQKIISMRITADDNKRSALCYLRILWTYLKKRGLDVDSSTSEKELMDKDEDFVCALLHEITH